MGLRPQQEGVKNGIYSAWAGGARIVMPVLPTGGGKTRVFTHIHGEFDAPSVAIAHRQELLSQIAGAFNNVKTPHRILAPRAIVQRIVALNSMEYGHSSYNPHARISVAGVNTFVKLDRRDVAHNRLFTIDEGHHVTKGNIWGDAIELLPPQCYGMLPTASPDRADGVGLSRASKQGYVDVMIEGPNMRWHIDEGYLTDYDIHGVEDVTDLTDVNITATGELNQKKLRAALHKNAKIVGNVVESYKQFAPGKLAVVFAVDIEEAGKLAQGFCNAGFPAQALSSKTPDEARAAILRQFKQGKVRILVNVDLFGEGFDLPAIECVIFARHTQSFSLYLQQFGRALRVMLGPENAHLLDCWGDLTSAQRKAIIAASPKPRAIVIDHVGNIYRHLGPPDWRTQWTIEPREKRSRGATDIDPEKLVTLCGNIKCAKYYKRYLSKCPNCGCSPVIGARSTPEHVDGDITLLDQETLRRLFGRIDVAPAMPVGAGVAAVRGQYRNWQTQQQAQAALRESIALWAGYQKHRGHPDRDAYKLFFLTFGVDVGTAQSLSGPQTAILAEKVDAYLNERGVVAA